MDLSGMRARAEGLMADFERMRATAGAARQRVLAVHAEAASDDGHVKATVDPRGRLVRLDIDPRVFRRPDSRRLADSIVEVVARAAADADRQVEEACAGFAPAADVRAHQEVDLETVFRRLELELDAGAEGEDA